jgi:spermidine synthase
MSVDTFLGFPRMPALVRPGKRGTVRVCHFTVNQRMSRFTLLRGLLNGTPEYCPPGKYAVLKLNGETMMSDTRMERLTNQQVLAHAHGRVLIVGLGLGMILHPIVAKAGVTKVVVVEKSQDVIKLIAPSLPPSVELVCADIFEWKPPTEKWDTIYFDIWPSVSEVNLPEMATLHRKFRPRLVRGGWMDSWCRADLKRQRRLRLKARKIREKMKSAR